jgi:integrase
MSEDLAYGWAVMRAACGKGLLAKGNPEKISLSGVYTLKNHNSFTAYGFDGQLKPNGDSHPVSLLTSEKDKAKALDKATEWISDLMVLWEHKYRTTSARGAGAASIPPDCVEQLLLDRLEVLEAELGDGATLAGYRSEVKVFLEILGPKRAHGPLDRIKPEHYARIRDARLRRLDPTRGAGAHSLRKLRFVLKDLPGFKPECLSALYASKRKRGRRSKKYTDEFPFLDSELKLIIDKLPEASPTAQGLILIGAMGSMNFGDAFRMRWKEYDEAREAVAKGIRAKTNNPFYFGIWPEFDGWVAKRNRQKGDIYIFPEIIFTQRQLKDPNRNKTPLKDEDKCIVGIRSRAYRFFGEFLVGVCKIVRPGVSFRSFRHYNLSQLYADGHSPQLLMDLSGQDGIDNFFKYIHSLPKHIRRASISLRSNFNAVGEGRERPVCLTGTDVAERVAEVVRENKDDLKRDLLQAVNQMGLFVVEAICRRLLGHATVPADGRAVIELDRSFIFGGSLSLFGLNHAAQPGEIQPLLALEYPNAAGRN